MATYPLPYVLAEAERKRQVLSAQPLRYFTSAIVAGTLIAVVLAVSVNLGQLLKTAGNGAYLIATAGFFGTALATIIFGKTELFTSNVLYMSVGVLARRLSLADLAKSWAFVYVGNFIGAMLFALIYAQTGKMAGIPADHVLFDLLEHKIHASWLAIFWKGVLCNWIICLAVWVPLRLENEMAKLALIMLLVFVFFFSGFEHSIANMAFFWLSWLHSPEATPLLADALHNLVPATLGNIVGGGVCVAAAHFYLERDTLPALQTQATEATLTQAQTA